MTRPPRVLRFVSAELDTSDAQGLARVELHHRDGEVFVGTAEVSAGDGLLAAAQATANAVREAIGGDQDTLTVVSVTVSEAFGRRTAWADVTGRYQGQQRRLNGFCVVDPDPVRAAALAVLNASNRFLGIG